MKETEFQRLLIRGLESVGAIVFNIHGHRYQKSGIPDFYCAVGSGAGGEWSGWIEVKVGKGAVSGLQVIRMKDLLRRGVPAFVVRWLDGNVYCELWYSEEEYVVLSCSELWLRSKGIARGKGIVDMLRAAGEEAVKLILKGGGV